jgi:hypothetical protein
VAELLDEATAAGVLTTAGEAEPTTAGPGPALTWAHRAAEADAARFAFADAAAHLARASGPRASPRPRQPATRSDTRRACCWPLACEGDGLRIHRRHHVVARGDPAATGRP